MLDGTFPSATDLGHVKRKEERVSGAAYCSRLPATRTVAPGPGMHQPKQCRHEPETRMKEMAVRKGRRQVL